MSGTYGIRNELWKACCFYDPRCQAPSTQSLCQVNKLCIRDIKRQLLINAEDGLINKICNGADKRKQILNYCFVSMCIILWYLYLELISNLPN